VRQIRMLRAMRRELETGLRCLLHGHAGGNPGHGQGATYGLPRQFPTLPGVPRGRPGGHQILASSYLAERILNHSLSSRRTTIIAGLNWIIVIQPCQRVIGSGVALERRACHG
jgi:hypothetical protein